MLNDQNFKIIAFLEGLSYILLLFIATPIKYIYNNPIFVKALGMPHGVLFVIYLIIAFGLNINKRWNNQQFATILIGSIIPFGTFYVTKKYLS